MIAISIFSAGLTRFFRLKKRPAQLSEFITFFEAYLLELNWSRKSVSEITYNFKDGEFAQYINTAKQLSDSYSPAQAYTDMNSYFEHMQLNSDDRAIIRYFFVESGQGSLAGEKSLCEKTLETLKIRLQEAESDYKRQGMLSLKLGILCGIWLIVMLI